MNTLLVSATAAFALVGIAPALAQTAAPAQPAPAATSKAMKVMSRAEVTQKVQRRFARLDADRDGFVTQAEAQAAARQRAARMQQRAAKMAERAGKRAQRRDPAAKFARLDSNSDGQISRAEAEAARAAVAARAGGKPVTGHAVGLGRLFERADTNRDGAVSRAEFDALHAMRHQRMAARGAARRHAFGGRMFAMADTDKDGRVSLHEATAVSLQRFDAADANRDGIVTRDERRQLREQKRAAAPRQ